MPPKKKIIHYDEPVPKRPHRKQRAKVVFDPSDNHIPKKRAKNPYKNEELIEAPTVQTTTTDKRKKQDAKKSKNLPVTEITELWGCSSIDTNTISPMHSPINSAVESVTPQITQATLKNCFICLTNSAETELLIDCSICSIKVHVSCLTIDEPLWKLKLKCCPWLCKKCRIQNCCQCFNDESQSKIQRRCITCEVGSHAICYESYNIKPLHKLDTDMYVCIPCMTLATQINPEEEEEEDEDEEEFKRRSTRPGIKKDLEDDESITSSFISTSSDEDDTDSKSNRSDSSSDSKNYDKLENDNIPNMIKWSKDEVFKYFSMHLPEKIVDQIIKYDIDGRALLSLKRTEIISKMGLKLGPALRFYQLVRILQSQSTLSRLSWE